jgi:hypothetical protein
MQREVLDDDLDDDDNDNKKKNDNHFGVKYNATIYDGKENYVAAVHLSRLSASPSFENADASIAPNLSNFFRNVLIAVVNDALRVQRSLECDVAALQQEILSIQNQ